MPRGPSDVLMEVANRVRERAIEDLRAAGQLGLVAYHDQLIAEGIDPAAVRTGIWSGIAEGPIDLSHPGNILSLRET